MKKIILLAVAMVLSFQHELVTAQDVNPRDSLKAVAFDKNLHDTIRLMACVDYTWNYVWENPDSLLYFINLFSEEAVKAGYIPGIIHFIILKGWYYAIIRDLKEAMKYFLISMEQAEEFGDPRLLAIAYTGVGQGYIGFGQYDKASEYFLKALKIYRELNDLDYEITTMGNLAFVYSRTGFRQKAMDTYLRIIELADSAKLGYPEIKTEALHKLGKLYLDFGKPAEAIKSFHEALTRYKRENAMVYYHIILCDLVSFFLRDSMNLYGKEIGDDRKSADIALEYVKELESWSLQVQDSTLLSKSYIYGAKAYLIKGENQKALEKLNAAEGLKQVGKNLLHEIFYYKNLAEIYEKYGDPGNALKYYKHYIVLKDSSKEVEITEKVKQLTESFEIGQMEDQLSMKEQQLTKNRVITYLFIAISALILILAGIVFYFLRHKQKAAKLLEQQVRETEKARYRAEQGEKFKERFLASMSHEIRTPLNAVIGMTSLLLDDPQPPKTETYLKNIRQAGEHLTGIINQVLDLSKIDAGKLELHEATFSLQDLMDETGNLLDGRAKEKNLQLIIHKGEGTPGWLYGDAGRILQVLLNLGGNAIKFTEQGSVQVNITTGEIKGEKTMVSFSVEDTGPGIAKEIQPVIFEEFVQAGKTEDQRIVGTGLGLSISRKLVERMGGTLKLESEPGKGSVFSFTIPLEMSTEEAYQAHQKEKELSVVVMKGKFRILAVEDNPSNQIVTEGLLEKILPESSVVIVEDGFKALALLEKEKFDLVLMDIRMPGIDGYETTRRLRLLKNENATIPVIALTASVIRSDIEHCLDAGMNGYVPKPVSGAVLAKILHDHLKIVAEKGIIRPEPEKENFLVVIHGKPEWSDRLYEICNGRKERFIKYLEIFLEQSESEIGKWQKWMDQKQSEKLAFSIHKMLPHIREFMDEKTIAMAVLLDQELRKGWSESHVKDVLSLWDGIQALHTEAATLMKSMGKGE